MDERRQLLNLAYRLLGSLVEAEDVVQETYARWYDRSAPNGTHREPGRLAHQGREPVALDQLRSARVRREQYVGEWVPEPLARRHRMADRSSVATAAVTRPTGSPWTTRSTWRSCRAGVDDSGRARRLHPARRLPLPVP